MAISLTVSGLIESREQLKGLLSFMQDDYKAIDSKLFRLNPAARDNCPFTTDYDTLLVRKVKLEPEIDGLMNSIKVIEKAIEDRGYKSLLIEETK